MTSNMCAGMVQCIFSRIRQHFCKHIKWPYLKYHEKSFVRNHSTLIQCSSTQIIFIKNNIPESNYKFQSQWHLYKTLNVCSLCGTSMRSWLHISSYLAQSSRKKARDPIHFKPKANKEPVIQAWKNITPAEIADKSKRDIDLVFEALLYVENSENYDRPNSAIDDVDVIYKVIKKLGYRCEIINYPESKTLNEVKIRDAVKRSPPDSSELINRPPVVTIMGHVDHGKTTLLDSLRHTSIAKEEFGGITQHIGAFVVNTPSGKITFLDTPGHAAFSAMRARGANVTDIIVLVVAADDGVMEQTLESIKYAKEANVPIIVAINKIDKPKVDIENVRKELLAHGVQLEEMGGDVQSVCISALEGTNLDHLIDVILTQAELSCVMGDQKGLVEGTVIEASTDQGRGKLSTALIQRGTLRKGVYIVAGIAWGKVRGMFDEWGKPIQRALPGTPVQIIGWRELPSAGDEILEVESEKRAREVVDWRLSQKNLEKQKEDFVHIQNKLEEHLKKYKYELNKRRQEGRYRKQKQAFREKEYEDDDSRPKLPLIIKGDVDGSVEAILDVLDTYHAHDCCRLDIIHYGIGPVSQNDVELAETFKGVVYGFNVSTTSKDITAFAKQKNVPVKEFKVIYKMIDDIKEEINNRLPPADKEEILGEASVLQEFLVSEGKKKVPVAGCRCTKGVLKKLAKFRIIRGEDIIHDGDLASLFHYKTEVDSIKKGTECGLRLQDPSINFHPGDAVICYQNVQVQQQTEWNPGF